MNNFYDNLEYFPNKEMPEYIYEKLQYEFYDIYIKGNELYLRFHSGDMFEPTNLKNSPLDKKSIEKYFYMLNFTYNLSNGLINLVNETEI